MAQPSEASQSCLLQFKDIAQDDKPRQLEEKLLQLGQRGKQLSTCQIPSPTSSFSASYSSSQPLNGGGVAHETGRGRTEGPREIQDGHIWSATRFDGSSTCLSRPLTDGLAHSIDFALNTGQNGTRHSGDAPSSKSPSMSNSQPPPGPHRPPVSYPNAATFQPGMPPGPPSYGSYAPHQTHGDMYRASAAATVNSSSMALPSMRTLDPMQSQQQPPPPPHPMAMAPPIGGPMGPGGHQIPYYNVAPPYGMTDQMRFALPGMADPRIPMSGGRHKKEIKRRTKTGCLTCRKRRIKCDEAHPTCNNCKKSKRECLGYDPIFKQAQAPAAIQPAPNSQSPTAPTLGSTPTATVPSSTTNQYRAPVVPSSYPPPVQSTTTTLDSSLSPTSQGSKPDIGFDYPPVIDPALQSNNASPTTGAPGPHYRELNPESLEQHLAGVSSQLGGGPAQYRATYLTVNPEGL